MSIKKLAKSINNLADAIRYHADGGATSATMTRSPLPEGFKVPKYEGKETEHCLSAALTEAEENFVDPYDAPPKATVTDAGWVLPPQHKFAAGLIPAPQRGVAPPKLQDYPPLPAEALEAMALGGVNNPKFMAGFSEGLVPAFQTSDGKSLNDTPPPPLAAERDETPMPAEKPELSQETPPPPPVVENDPTANDAPDFSEDMAIDNTNPVDAPGWQTLTVEELDAAPPSKFGQAVESTAAVRVAPPTPQSLGGVMPPVEELDAPSVETDADGLPWDERIHSGGKTLLVDGTWRLKRGVPDEEYQEVVAELKKLMAIPTPVDNTPPPPPNASVPVPPAPSATVDNLPSFIKAVTGAQLDKDVVLAAVKNAGLENIQQLGARPDLIAGIAKELGL